MTAKIKAIREFTWATLPSAAVYSGQIIHISDIGINGSNWKSNGSKWRPLGEIVLASSATAVTVAYPVTAKTVLGTASIPAGLLNIPGATLTVEPLFSMNFSLYSHGLKVELNTKSFGSAAGSSATTAFMVTTIHTRTAATQYGKNITITSAGSVSAITANGTEDLTAASTLNISATLTNNAGETATLDAWTLRFRA